MIRMTHPFGLPLRVALVLGLVGLQWVARLPHSHDDDVPDNHPAHACHLGKTQAADVPQAPGVAVVPPRGEDRVRALAARLPHTPRHRFHPSRAPPFVSSV